MHKNMVYVKARLENKYQQMRIVRYARWDRIYLKEERFLCKHMCTHSRAPEEFLKCARGRRLTLSDTQHRISACTYAADLTHITHPPTLTHEDQVAYRLRSREAF